MIDARPALLACALGAFLTAGGCATSGAFILSGEALTQAADDVDLIRTLALEHDSAKGPLPTQWKDARCRWTSEPNVARCATRYRVLPIKTWRSGTFRYERDKNGAWRWRGL
jgi:hypothetical protein